MESFLGHAVYLNYIILILKNKRIFAEMDNLCYFVDGKSERKVSKLENFLKFFID